MKPVVRKGKLSTWRDDRGFGFIESGHGGKEIFLHITALRDIHRRPQVGDVVYYQLAYDKDGRPQACNASIEGATLHPTSTHSSPALKSSSLVSEVLLLSLLPALGSVHVALSTLNPIPLLLYLVMSLITYGLYADDKARAKRKQWRVSEQNLHLCELLGGWIGAFVAQRRLRHKSSKASYQVVFRAIVAIHLMSWLIWLFFGKTLINSFLSQ